MPEKVSKHISVNFSFLTILRVTKKLSSNSPTKSILKLIVGNVVGAVLKIFSDVKQLEFMQQKKSYIIGMVARIVYELW